MPLGLISKRRIEAAIRLLTAAQRDVANQSSDQKIIDLTNTNYTWIPLKFGENEMPL